MNSSCNQNSSIFSLALPRLLSRSFSVSLFVALLYRWDAGAWSDSDLAGSSCVPSSDPSTVVNEYCSPNDEFHVSAQRLVWVEESSSEGEHPDTIVSYLAGEYDTDPKWQKTLSKGRYVRVSVSNAGAKVVSNVPVVTPTPMLESGSNGRVSNIEYVLPVTKDLLFLVILRDRTTWYQVSFFLGCLFLSCTFLSWMSLFAFFDTSRSFFCPLPGSDVEVQSLRVRSQRKDRVVESG